MIKSKTFHSENFRLEVHKYDEETGFVDLDFYVLNKHLKSGSIEEIIEFGFSGNLRTQSVNNHKEHNGKTKVSYLLEELNYEKTNDEINLILSDLYHSLKEIPGFNHNLH